VSKNEIIALDEDDVMAIVARRLVETHPWFKGKRIAFNSTANLAANDFHSLTTIINLYDLLTILFARIRPRHRIDEMKYYRPADSELEKYYQHASAYFTALRGGFPSLDRYFGASDYSEVVKRYRGEFGGNVLFRPIGLTMMTEVIAVLSRSRTLKRAVAIASRSPLALSRPPYLEVLWDKRRGMGNQGKALARDLLLHMHGELSREKSEEVGRKYARALEIEPGNWQRALNKLPNIA
jgi:DNA sulfur modification protein DndB